MSWFSFMSSTITWKVEVFEGGVKTIEGFETIGSIVSSDPKRSCPMAPKVGDMGSPDMDMLFSILEIRP